MSYPSQRDRPTFHADSAIRAPGGAPGESFSPVAAVGPWVIDIMEPIEIQLKRFFYLY